MKNSITIAHNLLVYFRKWIILLQIFGVMLAKHLLVSFAIYTNNIVYVQYKLNKIDPYICTPLPENITNFDTVYLSSDNVAKVVQNGSQNTGFKNSLSYTYDNKINPFQQLNVFSSFYNLGFDVGYRYWNSWGVLNDALYIIGMNKNNVSSIQLINGIYNQQFTYIYDSDDYPLSVIITTNSGISTSVIKVKYEYVQ